ncbi:Casein kinase II subunit beta [Dichanthelium oligosanthes]|uniref:Casein kinase II subunit beta n=1 Tax=Dichanthelium oligosanthes TaxID=888268 RepID=A0A1E5V1W6_9POAL|nr:Casein kinase II subunit beta [Dichanthelium oligosanthes]
MHRDRGASAAAGGAGDRKRIGEPMDRSSPSTSWGFSGGREKERIGAGKLPEVPRSGGGSTAMSKSKLSDGESETDSEESDVSGSDGEDTSWISWFCSLRGNEFFCEVDDEYIQDDFNLCLCKYTGDMFTEEQNELIESAAEMLYGLIHVRYIITSKGLAAMLDKYKTVDFGRCPRVNCSGQPCLPVGQSDIPRSSHRALPLICHVDIDGTYFGTTFPHIFLMTYPHLKPQKPSQQYVPRVFGFKIHKP